MLPAVFCLHVPVLLRFMPHDLEEPTASSPTCFLSVEVAGACQSMEASLIYCELQELAPAESLPVLCSTPESEQLLLDWQTADQDGNIARRGAGRGKAGRGPKVKLSVMAPSQQPQPALLPPGEDHGAPLLLLLCSSRFCDVLQQKGLGISLCLFVFTAHCHPQVQQQH